MSDSSMPGDKTKIAGAERAAQLNASERAPTASRDQESGHAGHKPGKRKFPSILSELGLKVTSAGIVLPESRRNFLRRRKEAREMGLIAPYNPLPRGQIDNGKKHKARSRKQKETGVLLDDLHSDLFHSANANSITLCDDVLAAEGVNVNVQSNADLDGIGTKSTALHVAAMKGYAEIVTALLVARADANLVTGRGETPVQLATRAGHIEVVRLLTLAGGAPADAEGTLRILDKAPVWDARKKGKLHAALSSDKAPWKWRRQSWQDGRGSDDQSSGVWERPDDEWAASSTAVAKVEQPDNWCEDQRNGREGSWNGGGGSWSDGGGTWAGAEQDSRGEKRNRGKKGGDKGGRRMRGGKGKRVEP